MKQTGKERFCTSCGCSSASVRFAKHSQTPDGISTICSDCANGASRKRYHALSLEERKRRAITRREQPAAKNKELLRKYGINLQHFAELIDLQKNKCKICSTDFNHTAKLNIDHDHQSGKVRGLLCRRCNIGIGKLGESSKTIELASQYLEKETYLVLAIKPLLLKLNEKSVDFRHDRRVRVSPEGKKRVLDYQKGRCAICAKILTAEGKVTANLDHNHFTANVRGYLCPSCNHGIGMFKEDLALLASAKAYLESLPPIFS